MSEPRRVLLVGAGVMGAVHAAAIRAAGDLVVAVVDADARRPQDVAPTSAAYPTIVDALAAESALDAAVIATPSVFHMEQATHLVRAGIPVLVEKPHRIPGQDPRTLSEADARGDLVFVGMSTRHWPGIEETIRAVKCGELGEIISYTDRMAFRLAPGALPRWYFDPSVSGGGVTVTNGVHALDRVRAILGGLTVQRCLVHRIDPAHETEDAAVILGTAGAVPVAVELLWMPYEPLAPGLVVTGTAGSAVVAMDGSWRITTVAGTRSGPSIDLNTVPFNRQWAAFINRVPGFGLAELEPTLQLIESLDEMSPTG